MNRKLYVEVHLDSSSEPVIYETALSAFQKGDMFCVAYEKGDEVFTDKYPMVNIFRVRNSYTGKP